VVARLRPRSTIALASCIVGVVVAAVLVALPRVGAVGGRAVGPGIGISYGDTSVWMSHDRLVAALDDAVEVDANWIRTDLAWPDVQPDGPTDFRWQLFDRVIDGARARKLNVLPILTYTPAWAGRPDCSGQFCEPADPGAFARFAAAAVRRYAPLGVRAWEIWNEPNLTVFWKPTPSAAGYTALLRATTAAIRSVDPGAYVVSGGLAATSTADGNVSQGAFLDGIGALGGLGLVDAVGYHPYTYPYLPSARTAFLTSWERMSAGPDSLRVVLARYGRPDLPVWLTEVGAPTGGPGTPSDGRPATIGPATTHVTEQRQAQIAADAVRTVAAVPWIGALFWYCDRDLGSDTATPENFYGLRRMDGSAKPALSAFRDAVTALRRGTLPS
jgi:polysaccharide biosynthesis protein PslG